MHCHHRSVFDLLDIAKGRRMDLHCTYNLDLLKVSMHESLEMFVGHLARVGERESRVERERERERESREKREREKRRVRDKKGEKK